MDGGGAATPGGFFLSQVAMQVAQRCTYKRCFVLSLQFVLAHRSCCHIFLVTSLSTDQRVHNTPTFYQAIDIHEHSLLHHLSRPVCVCILVPVTRLSHAIKKLSTQSVTMDFFFPSSVFTVWSVLLWLLFRIPFAGHTKEQPGEFLHLSSPFYLSGQCDTQRCGSVHFII